MAHLYGAVIAAAALLLGGCGGEAGGGDAAPRQTPAKMKASSPYVEQLKTLNEMNRGLALRRAVQDSGKRCRRVAQSGYQQDYTNLSMWVARCEPSGEWAIFIAPNGDVQVRDCKNSAELGLPACRFSEETGQEKARR